jgi:drug/metabolite transporter (DMT)-like permease
LKKPGKLLATTAFAAMCLIWGTTWSVIQIGLEGIPPLGGVALRFAIASAILLIGSLLAGVKLGRTRAERALWLVNGVLSYTVVYGIVYWAEQWVPSGLAAVLWATYPFFVAMFAQFMLPAEKLSRLELMGIVIGFGGVGLVFSDDFSALGGSQVVKAAMLVLLSPLAAAAGTVSVKRWGAGIHPFSLTAVPMGLTAAIMGALALKYEPERIYTWNPVTIGSILYLAVMGSAVTFMLYYWLLAHYPAKRMALITYIIPIVAVIIGVLRGEPFTLRMLAGSALVLSGVALAIHKGAGKKSTAS